MSLPPTSAVEVIESVLCFQLWVFPSVCQFVSAHDASWCHRMMSWRQITSVWQKRLWHIRGRCINAEVFSFQEKAWLAWRQPSQVFFWYDTDYKIYRGNLFIFCIFKDVVYLLPHLITFYAKRSWCQTNFSHANGKDFISHFCMTWLMYFIHLSPVIDLTWDAQMSQCLTPSAINWGRQP